MERCISKLQETVYRLCHHEFGGKTVEQAAKTMKVSTRTIHRLLADLKAVAPQLWPLLPPEQAELWDGWFVRGLSVRQLALILKQSERGIHAKLKQIKIKMDYHPMYHRTTKSLESLTEEELEGCKRLA